jgi:hypothetical protein
MAVDTPASFLAGRGVQYLDSRQNQKGARGYIPKLPAHLRPRWETPDPPGVTGSYGPRVIEWASRELGLVFGPWQAYVICKILRHNKAEDLVHREALFSTGRQNGKSVIVRGFYGWLLDEGRKIGPFAEWRDIRSAAHDAKQARIIYRAVSGDLRGIPRLTHSPDRAHGERLVRPPVRLSRNIGIETDSLFFDTLTSEPGSARGLSIGALAFDEVLTQRDFDMWSAVNPTQSSQRSAIRLLTSSAGHADSVVLRDYYNRMVRQASGDEAPVPTFYGVWWESGSIDVGYTAEGVQRPLTEADWAEISKANPALGDGRLDRAAIEGEHRIFPREAWQRERLNHFIDVVADGAFNPGTWAANRVSSPLEGLTGPYALGVDIQPGWERASIVVAGHREDGKVGIEVYRDLRRTPDNPVTAARIIAEIMAFPDIESVVTIAYDQVSGAAPAFLRNYEETGLPWDGLKPAAMVAVTIDFTERVLAGTLAVDDPLLDAQIAMVAKRDVGQDGAFRFSRQASTGPIDGVIAAALAVHAIGFVGTGPLIG